MLVSYLQLHNPRAPRKAGGGTPLPQSFYRRPLPSRLVSFTSAQGKALLAGALAGGGGGSFFEVMNQFEMQAEPVSCGLASLAIALNTLELSSWRASQESTRQRPVTEAEILSDLVPEELRVPFMKDGISLSEISMVASKVPGLSVKPLPSDQVAPRASLFLPASLPPFLPPLHHVLSLSLPPSVFNFERDPLPQQRPRPWPSGAACSRMTVLPIATPPRRTASVCSVGSSKPQCQGPRARQPGIQSSSSTSAGWSLARPGLVTSAPSPHTTGATTLR